MNISCDVIQDLIPLVKDGVASIQSEELVQEHISSCESCRYEYESMYTQKSSEAVDDKKILASIRKSIFVMGLIILIAGSFMGVAISNTNDIFYNFIIMPAIGAVSCIALKKKWFVVPACVFVLSYLWYFMKYAMERGFVLDIVATPLFFSIIFSILILIGVAIAKLLRYAFGKGV